MSLVRKAAVAGSFYPGEAGALSRAVDAMLAAAQPPVVQPKALVVPHAGYIYSGPIAASAYASLKGRPIRKVVLVGPAHFVAVQGLALPAADLLETPLGTIEVDGELSAKVQALGYVRKSEPAHAREHSLEVQLPFLQRVLGEFTLLPLAVGRATGTEIAEVLETVWGGEETLILISTDLSHYLPYAAAQQIDGRTAQQVVALDYEELEHDQACGATGLRGLLEVAKKRSLKSTQLDLRNSGDTAGDKSRVVGYGAWAFEEPR
jgi:AmmeMemoRadiSam system protein B